MLRKGFSLVEALVGILILLVGIVSIYYLFSKFSEMDRSRVVHACLVEAVASAIKLCKNGASPPPTFTCGNIEVALSGSCNVPQDGCAQVSVRGEVEDYTLELVQTACNIGGGT